MAKASHTGTKPNTVARKSFLSKEESKNRSFTHAANKATINPAKGTSSVRQPVTPS